MECGSDPQFVTVLPLQMSLPKILYATLSAPIKTIHLLAKKAIHEA
jgi:hypothetical protein